MKMIDVAVESNYTRLINDPILQKVRAAVEKSAFLYELRQLSGRRPVDVLIKLAKEYNATRADTSYRVETFVINGPNGGFSEVDMHTGEVRPKQPYQVLPMI